MPQFVPVYHKSSDNQDRPIYIAKTAQEYKELVHWQDMRTVKMVGVFLALILVTIFIFRRKWCE